MTTYSTAAPSYLRWASGALIAMLLVLSGCASTGSSLLSSGPAADPRLTTGNDAQFFSKSGFQACAAGAGVGILACMVSNSNNKATCAIVAGIAACGVAMGANYYLDYRRSQYANTGERLNAMTTDVKADTQKVIERTNTAMQVISDNKTTLNKIQSDMKAKQLDQDKAKQQLAQIDKNIEVMSADVDNMKNKVKQYEDVSRAEKESGNTKQVKNIDSEISKMKQKVASLETEVDELYMQRSAITLG
ncbi:hypothetical protein [Castellaniella sp.]|uniref:hypothetical protein n=1 Tax=Castellaniella sp. TaxID=1955812 RepID=UPI002AFFF863|nr:hypothetical protein [Castellaniella sp.]